MMQVDTPANVSLLSGILYMMVDAEVIDPSWSTALVYDFHYDEDYVNEAMESDVKMLLSKQMYELGFTTYNPVLNIGGLYVFFIIISIEMVVLATIWAIIKILKHMQKTQSEGGDPSIEVGPANIFDNKASNVQFQPQT